MRARRDGRSQGGRKAKEFEIPEDFFDFDGERPDYWQDNPDVRRAVEWLKGYIAPGEWRKRRLAAVQRVYQLIVNGAEPGETGRFFDERDSFAYHLFLAEASIDHVWNYDPIFGSRVVPVFAAIGRNLNLLRAIDGIDDRVVRMVGAEKAQPNGPFFELLVAAAYARSGGKVAFVPERRGGPRTHDMDVTQNGRVYAVECKRMEVSDFGEIERTRVRALWGPSTAHLANILGSTFAQVEFLVPIADVPNDYLTRKTKAWQLAPEKAFEWQDEFGRGSIRSLDLRPLRKELEDSMILNGSTRLAQLLTGRYKRHQAMISSLRIKFSDNPRYIRDCDYATVLEWTPLAPASISGRARDVLRKVADGLGQLPMDRPGIIHVGFEAVEGDAVEQLRYQRIVASMSEFDPRETPLEYVYSHFLAPESPPDQGWAYDETTDWRGIRPTAPRPLVRPFLVLDQRAQQRLGGHWEQ
ncbi:hypothetical protein C100_21140 [Sphingobium sp. C100]|uniref:hypothetical protein n=2 Tax=unclassified Sphingobium TaxID=2611147 RepID=UPI0003D67D3E|nr:hypothetical protein [Sphingobium sp. C100]ETI59479.1 hypothetical protein C100_21140 [Sphingobium sp. C100]